VLYQILWSVLLHDFLVVIGEFSCVFTTRDKLRGTFHAHSPTTVVFSALPLEICQIAGDFDLPLWRKRDMGDVASDNEAL
jgi:hypothetical protein